MDNKHAILTYIIKYQLLKAVSIGMQREWLNTTASVERAGKSSSPYKTHKASISKKHDSARAHIPDVVAEYVAKISVHRPD